MTVLDQQVHLLSPAARARLGEELEELTERRAELVAQQGSETGGDLVDQASVATQQIEIESIDRRLTRIRDLLSAAAEAEAEGADAADTPDADTVAVGSTVTLRFSDGSTESYHVGQIEEQSDDIVALTPTSPLGQALLGQRVGDSVTYEAPAGKLTVEIVEVSTA